MALRRGDGARQPLGEVRPGQRVQGLTPTERGTAEPAPGWGDPAAVRLVHVRVTEGVTVSREAWLLRPAAWLEEADAAPGESVWLDLPEMGFAGPAAVVSVEPVKELERGPGRLVTGVFKHYAGRAYDLHVEGEGELIGVTATHPFWSVDRDAWAPVKELRKGERLQGLDGKTPRVQSLILRAEPEPVYNIEVEGDHCYRVGEQGILVHNASAGNACGDRFKMMAGWTERGATLRDDVIYLHQGFPVGSDPQRNFRNLKTTAVAIIQHPDCSWECVYAVSGQRDDAPPPDVRVRAAARGYRVIRGSGRHAEERIINNLPTGATLLAIAPCRPACTDETTKRTDQSCSTQIQQQGQQQGFAVMLFDPVGGQNRCL